MIAGQSKKALGWRLVAGAALIPISVIAMGWFDQAAVAGVPVQRLNETARMNAAIKDIAIPKPSINNRIGEIRGDTKCAITSAFGIWSDEIGIKNSIVNRARWYCGSVAKFDRDLQQTTGSFPVIVYMEFKIISVLRHSDDLPRINLLVDQNTFPHSTARHVGALHFAAMEELAAIDSPKATSQERNSESGSGSDSRRYPVKSFADLPERDKGYVVCGAFFVAALIGIAIWCFRWDEA